MIKAVKAIWYHMASSDDSPNITAVHDQLTRGASGRKLKLLRKNISIRNLYPFQS